MTTERIVLNVLPTFPSQGNVTRFIARRDKITGVAEDNLGVKVSIAVDDYGNDKKIYVSNSFDELAEFMCS